MGKIVKKVYARITAMRMEPVIKGNACVKQAGARMTVLLNYAPMTGNFYLQSLNLILIKCF